MLEYLFYSMTVLAIIATYLNTKKKKICFVLWIFTNTTFLIQSVYLKAWNLALLYLIYLGLAFYGLREWSIKISEE